MNIQQIPLNKLVPGAANVRKTGADSGVEELAANIKALGLLQNLQVREAEGDKFEVVAGRRRLLALKLLAKQKAIAKTEDIACNVLAEGEDATEISLAENVMRLPMHPADQYEAFKALADNGKGPEDIAARFGCSPMTVQRRLKLASVSPALMDAYRAEEMSLDQLMAFTASDDHGQQEKVWSELAEYNRHPATIRRLLTNALVEADDDRAVFVGIDAYVAAGGGVLRDLFDEQHEGYLTDTTLLDRLATERLEREAASIRAEGWKWVEIIPDLEYSALREYRRVRPVIEPLSEEQQAELDRLTAEHDALVEQHGDDPSEVAAAEIEALSDKIEALSGGSPVWQPEDIALAGAVLSIGSGGKVAVYRGLVRPEDMPADEESGDREEGRRSAAAHRSNGATSQQTEGALPAPLVEDLTAYRTAALRAELAANSEAALAAVVHAFALPFFYRYGAKSCLDIKVASASLTGSAEGIDDSEAVDCLAIRHAHWRNCLPQEAERLWAWCLAQDSATLLELLAYCAACSVNAVVKRHERMDDRIAHADQLAGALTLDMAQWWQPTKASYLARVSKARVLEAVAEGVSKSAAENLAKLKKDELAKLAEERLAGTGWLPALLRSPAAPEPEAETLAA
jgi:ParB family chromosome partitioning protein